MLAYEKLTVIPTGLLERFSLRELLEANGKIGYIAGTANVLTERVPQGKAWFINTITSRNLNRNENVYIYAEISTVATVDPKQLTAECIVGHYKYIPLHFFLDELANITIVGDNFVTGDVVNRGLNVVEFDRRLLHA